MNVLVVPTIREKHIQEFLSVWGRETWDQIVIVEDNPTKTFDIDVDHHYSWQEIEADLKENAWIISKRDSAIRCYGFLKAAELGADYIFTLDDDCYPIGIPDKFVQGHIDAIEKTTQWTESVPGMRTRGLPYFELGTLPNVVMNVGLWNGIPDIDAIQSFANPPHGPFVAPNISRVMPQGQYFPICGMNLCFKRKMLPAAYFPLMGMDSPYRRFDDIWFGVIAKKVCDHMNWKITCGTPHIDHKRASSPFVNLVKEAPGIEANESFWKKIEDFQFVNPDSATECVLGIGVALELAEKDYWKKMGQALKTWAYLSADLC